MKTKRAFTITEVSIAILIIGILVGGIMMGRNLYRKSKLSSARTITQSSVVTGTYGLSLWLDATSEKAFANNMSDQDLVSEWKDTNTQTNEKSHASQSNSSKQPLYISNGINGLPALKCDGSNDRLSIDFGSAYFPSAAPSISNNFTIFLVARATTTHEIDAESNDSLDGEIGQKYVLGATNGDAKYGDPSYAGMGLSLGTNGIAVYEHTDVNYLPALASYAGTAGLDRAAIITIDYNKKTPTILLNGSVARVGLTSTKDFIFPVTKFCSSSDGAFNGYVGEVIVFNNRLSTKKRRNIEKYLAKKWNIDLTS